jgi:hypothetical protein
MAKRSKKSGSFLGLDKTAWLLLGGGAGVILYFVLLGKTTGIEPVDEIIEGFGEGSGWTGTGKGYLPDILPASETHAMFGDDDDYGDTDVTVA